MLTGLFRVIGTAIAVILLLCLAVYNDATDPVLDSLGQYTNREFYTCGGFRDYTDYAIYRYDSADLSGNAYFLPLDEQRREALDALLEDFRQWVDIHSPDHELMNYYGFDHGLIDSSDYLYIHNYNVDPEYSPMGDYDVYFFDTQSNTLYYFHNNK